MTNKTKSNKFLGTLLLRSSKISEIHPLIDQCDRTDATFLLKQIEMQINSTRSSVLDWTAG
ncbi:MAG: hypothetical protein ACJAXI_003303 [Crocinitomicaceae bacterium]|jgi:hypothetical protein